MLAARFNYMYVEHAASSSLYRQALKPRSHRARQRASSNLHTSKERCQFKLYIGYWTSNNNKWPKCPCRYRTPSPDNTCANDVIDNDVTDNDVLTAGWICIHYLQVRQMWSRRCESTRRDALGVNGALAEQSQRKTAGTGLGLLDQALRCCDSTSCWSRRRRRRCYYYCRWKATILKKTRYI